jgi:CHASE3 domain sensor protein
MFAKLTIGRKIFASFVLAIIIFVVGGAIARVGGARVAARLDDVAEPVNVNETACC